MAEGELRLDELAVHLGRVPARESVLQAWPRCEDFLEGLLLEPAERFSRRPIEEKSFVQSKELGLHDVDFGACIEHGLLRDRVIWNLGIHVDFSIDNEFKRAILEDLDSQFPQAHGLVVGLDPEGLAYPNRRAVVAMLSRVHNQVQTGNGLSNALGFLGGIEGEEDHVVCLFRHFFEGVYSGFDRVLDLIAWVWCEA